LKRKPIVVIIRKWLLNIANRDFLQVVRSSLSLGGSPRIFHLNLLNALIQVQIYWPETPFLTNTRQLPLMSESRPSTPKLLRESLRVSVGKQNAQYPSHRAAPIAGFLPIIWARACPWQAQLLPRMGLPIWTLTCRGAQQTLKSIGKRLASVGKGVRFFFLSHPFMSTKLLTPLLDSDGVGRKVSKIEKRGAKVDKTTLHIALQELAEVQELNAASVEVNTFFFSIRFRIPSSVLKFSVMVT
jgi:hypothetical protein